MVILYTNKVVYGGGTLDFLSSKQSAKQLIKAEFPSKLRHQFINLICRGYSLVNILEETDEMYKTDIGKDLLPYVLNLAVQYEFVKAVKANLLPFECSSKLNFKKNCHHIELESENCIIAINQLNKKSKIPRYAIFRQNRSLNNGQICFFDDDIDNKNKYFAMITHEKSDSTYKNPKFINIGFPNVKGNDWIYNYPVFRESLSC